MSTHGIPVAQGLLRKTLRRFGSASVLYAAGCTNKTFAPLDSYFPLVDPENGAWFEGTFGGPPPNAVDGFIAAFCTEVLTTVNDRRLHDAPRPVLQWLGGDQWRVCGLENGSYHMRLLDISGRELSRTWVQVTDSLSEPFACALLPTGTYVAVFDGPVRAAFKIPVQR